MNTYGLVRLVHKPELRKTQEEISVSTFTVVFNERRKVNNEYVEDPHFLDCVIWDKAAEYVCNNLDKGDLLYIASATPRQRKWTDSEGKKRSQIVFRINDFQRMPRLKNETEKVAEEAA
jgi:single-strand DNA-binding protein